MSQKRSGKSKRNRKSHTPRGIAIPTSSAATAGSSSLSPSRQTSDSVSPAPKLKSSGLPASRPATSSAPAKVRPSSLPASRPAVGQPTRPSPHVSGQYVGPAPKVRARSLAVAAPAARADVPPEASAVASVDQPVEAPSEAPAGAASARRPVALPEQSAWIGGVVVLLVAALVVFVGVRMMSHHGSDAPTSGDPYAAPVPVAAGGAYVRTRVAGETLRVTHWIHTDRRVHQVRISAPQATAEDGGAIAVSDLVLASDGRIVQGEQAPTAGSTHTYDVLPGHRIYVTYVLSGALLHSGTPVGRALAPVTALGVSTVGDPIAQVTHSVVGAQILSLACTPNRPGAIPRPCGTVRDGSWSVDLTQDHAGDRVMAQMDLS